MSTHHKCGKPIPSGSRAGHCTGCCESFAGETAFEAHRHGEHPRSCKLTPQHWQDSRGVWHHGERMTEERRRAFERA